MNTYVPKMGEVKKAWVVIDAKDKVLGRVAVEAARVLRGKHKPTYTPYLDCGDNVIIINSKKAKITGAKFTDKKYYRHSGYPGGIKEMNFEKMMARKPAKILELAVSGMLPKTRLGRQMFKKLKIYIGAEHPHAAQQPKSLDEERTTE